MALLPSIADEVEEHREPPSVLRGPRTTSRGRCEVLEKSLDSQSLIKLHDLLSQGVVVVVVVVVVIVVVVVVVVVIVVVRVVVALGVVVVDIRPNGARKKYQHGDTKCTEQVLLFAPLCGRGGAARAACISL